MKILEINVSNVVVNEAGHRLQKEKQSNKGPSYGRQDEELLQKVLNYECGLDRPPKIMRHGATFMDRKDNLF